MIFIDSVEYREALEELADRVQHLSGLGRWSEKQAFGFLFRKSKIYDSEQYLVVRDNVLRILRGRRLREKYLLAGAQEMLEQGNEILCPIE